MFVTRGWAAEDDRQVLTGDAPQMIARSAPARSVARCTNPPAPMSTCAGSSILRVPRRGWRTGVGVASCRRSPSTSCCVDDDDCWLGSGLGDSCATLLTADGDGGCARGDPSHDGKCHGLENLDHPVGPSQHRKREEQLTDDEPECEGDPDPAAGGEQYASSSDPLLS